MSNIVERNYDRMPSRSWPNEIDTWTDLTEENLVDRSKQRTYTQNLAVMSIGLTDIAVEDCSTTAD